MKRARVYPALDGGDPVRLALSKTLKGRKMSKYAKFVKHLKLANVVVVSTDRIKTLPKKLPKSVELVLITDCGGGQRYQFTKKIKVANASLLFDAHVANKAWILVVNAGEDLQSSIGERKLRLGIIGLGNIGIDILLRFHHTLESTNAKRLLEQFPLGSIVINDIRTLSEPSVIRLRQPFVAYGIDLRWDRLDETLMASDIVIVAVHRGPGADPLLGAQELDLMNKDSWLIDLSEEGVVDYSAIDPMYVLGPLPKYIHVDEVARYNFEERVGTDLEVPPKEVAKFLGKEIKRFAKGLPIRLVEIPGARMGA